jgi:hypothetical protein
MDALKKRMGERLLLLRRRSARRGGAKLKGIRTALTEIAQILADKEK